MLSKRFISNMFACQVQVEQLRTDSTQLNKRVTGNESMFVYFFILHLYCWFNRKHVPVLIQIQNYFDKNTKIILIFF